MAPRAKPAHGPRPDAAGARRRPRSDARCVLGAARYNNKFAKFDPNANGGTGAWTTYSNDNIEIDAASAVDSVRDLFVTVDGRGTHRVRVHDLKNPGAAPVTVTTTGDDAPEQHGQIGFEFDPVTEQFVAWLGGNGGTSRTSVYTLTPPSSNWQTGSWVWAEVTADAGNTVTPTAQNPNGSYSRWRYVPSKNVFIVVNQTNENVFFYKLSEGGGGPPAPTVSLSANPTTITSGASTTLSWSSTNATSCTASGDWSGSKALTGSQVMSNLTASSYAGVHRRGRHAQRQRSVTVNPDGGGGVRMTTGSRAPGCGRRPYGFDDRANAGGRAARQPGATRDLVAQRRSGAGSLQFECVNTGASVELARVSRPTTRQVRRRQRPSTCSGGAPCPSQF